MKIKMSLLALLFLVAGAAQAGLTGIAQVPLLNIKGTGTVKPNLMLVYDNSGSMDFEFTPDILAYKSDAPFDNTLQTNPSNVCRAAALLSTRRRNCAPGDPPYASPDINKQYYNPSIRYAPPVNANGTAFNIANYGNASPWDKVRNDGFDSSAGTINLATGFTDLKWCDSNSANCVYNTAAYTYPNDTLYKGVKYSSNPYYYRISVAEYCSDAKLTDCATVPVGGAAPAGKPFPAKVRWCTTTDLDTKNCQSKVDKTHIYPRFSTPGSAAVVGYGTITIGASGTTNSQTISSVTVGEGGTNVTITNAAVVAPSGTNGTGPRAQLANDLAASIIAKAGLVNQYGACVRTPSSGSSVPTCSSRGITLGSDYIVAVIPLDCLPGATNKTTQCSPLADSSRSGWGLTVAMTSTPPTALITVAGASAASKALTIDSVSLGGAPVFGPAPLPGGKLTFTSGSQTSAAVATGIKNQIGALGTIRAYTGGNTITTVCKNAPNPTNVVCLVDTGTSINGAVPSVGALTNGGNLSFVMTNGGGGDVIPISTTALSAGNAIFVRTDIVSGNTYPKDANRIDCAGSTCTYTEEMTNFANWYIFYRSRNQMMKTSVGLAFAPLSSNYRVGLALLRETAAGSGSSGISMTPDTFSGTSRSNWYSTLYAATANSGTPLRSAMHKVAQMFATTDGVVTEVCQPNFMLVTTDGYWNGGTTSDVKNIDNKEDASHFCTKAAGCVDPTANSTNTLADIALYWYNGGSNGAPVSLVSSLNEDMTKEGTVPGRDGENKHLHIQTYTLGLGVDGLMTYDPDYDNPNNLSGDFSKILNSVSSGCPWSPDGKYNWPDAHTEDPNTDYQSRVDDLWHAAVNGHGKYFTASVPDEVVYSLTSALNNMQAVFGAASAAATSTPNISQQDNDIFSDTFTTVKWFGELSAQKIDINTGNVGSSSTWITSATLGKHVFDSSDERHIYMMDTSASKALKNFTYGDMSGTERGWFDNKCSVLSQCFKMTAAQKVTANDGNNLVNWLRGQQKYADDAVFRSYSNYQATPTSVAIPIVLGDIASSKPAYLRDPRKAYTLTGYAKYKSDQTAPTPGARKAMVYTAANDGMLHAFDAATGEEQWAYAPRITMKKLPAQASVNYSNNHQFTTDGSPELGDVQIGTEWRTVLVAGLGAGGRGYYALDVTDPLNPVAMWELCADPAVCSKNEPNIGLTFGNPQFGMWNGKWVVYLTSGYNNVPNVDGVTTGDGQGHLYIVEVATGNVLMNVSTGSGTAATPSGLAKITAISSNPATDPVTTYIYGGDNQGQMWRFDLTDSVSFTVPKIKMGDAGALQPITTRPDIAFCQAQSTGSDGKVTVSGKRVVVFGTGRLLDVPDMKTTDMQSLYLLKDADGAAGNPIADIRGSTMVKQTLTVQDSSHTSNYLVSSNPVDLATKNGWFIDWNINSGERMNLDPKIVNGGVNVVTNVPGDSTACSVGGSSNVYQVGLCTGSMPSPEMLAGSSLSSASAAVGFIIVRLPSGQLKMISTLADGKKLTKEVKPFTTLGARKVGWRRVAN